MSEISKSTPLEEVAAIVSEALRKQGVSVVLTGGAVVSIYSENEYQSWDLDFVIEGLSKKVEPIMEGLGFKKEKGRHFVHPETSYFVEFPAGPLAIGDEVIRKVAEFRTEQGTVRLLPPTECVMDRLAAFYHWNDPQGLDQAVSVASRHPVKMERIRKWSEREGMLEKFDAFALALKRFRSDRV